MCSSPFCSHTETTHARSERTPPGLSDHRDSRHTCPKAFLACGGSIQDAGPGGTRTPGPAGNPSVVTSCKCEKCPPRMRSSLSSCQPPPYPEGHEDDHHENYQPQEHQRAGSLGRFIPGRDALGRRGDADAEPDVEVGTPSCQDHVVFPGTCVRRYCQGYRDACRFPGEDFDRGDFQPRHGISRIGRVRDIHRGVSRVLHVQGSHRVAVPRRGGAPDADQWVHVFLAVSIRRLPGTPRPGLQTLLSAISTDMRLSPVTYTQSLPTRQELDPHW
jgi:hypothetical protein